MEKPPIGIMPEQIWKGKRLESLDNAIERRLGTRWEIPQEWLDERNRLAQELEQRKGPIHRTFTGTITDIEFPSGPDLADMARNISKAFHKRTTDFEDLEGKNVRVKLSKMGGILDGHVFEAKVDQHDGDVIKLGNVCVHVDDITHIEGREV